MAMQILDRQVDSPQYTGIADAFNKGKELAADIDYKKGLIEYQKEANKLRAREVTSAEDQQKAESAVKRWELAGKVVEYGKNVAMERVNGVVTINPEKWQKYMTTVLVHNPDLAAIFGSDELAKMTPNLSAEEQVMYGQDMSGSGQTTPVDNSNRTGAISGVSPGSNTPVITGGSFRTPTGNTMQWSNPQANANVARQNAIATKEGGLSVPERLPAATLDKFQEGTAAAMRADNTISTALNNPDFKSYMGLPGGPKRMAAKYLLGEQGQKYTAFAAQSKEMVNIYRKMITGAQASVQELNSYIKTVLGDPETDTYETFLLKNMVATYTALGNVNQQIKLYKGYDTSPLQDMATQLTAQASGISDRLKQQTGLNVDSLISSLPVDKEGKDIAQLMIAAGNAGRPISYEVAKKVIRGR